jgi:Zn-dependent protease with chaperone function
MDPGERPKAMPSMGISARPSGLMTLMSKHPPTVQRIERLKQAA